MSHQGNDEPTLPMHNSDDEGGGARPESSDDDEESWLVDLTTCHRGGALPGPAAAGDEGQGAQPAADDEGEGVRPESSDEDWLVELTSCHRGGELPGTLLAVRAANTPPPVNHLQGPRRLQEEEQVENRVYQDDPREPRVSHARSRSRTESSRSRTGGGRANVAAASSSGRPLRLAIVVDLAGRGCAPPWHNREDLVRFASSFGIVPTVEPPIGNAVVWCLPPTRPLFSNFQHCARRLVAWMIKLGPLAFKIGIAADPIDRWTHSEYGYLRDRQWHVMEVCWQGPANMCRALEIDLIAASRGISGCYNDSPGGEGVRPDRTHMCFTYLVCAAAGTGLSLRQAWDLRARQR